MEEHEHDAHRAEEARVLTHVAPELIPHVHAFLHGGMPGYVAQPVDYLHGSIRLRALHDLLTEAVHRHRMPDAMILAAAVRIQANVVYETLKGEFSRVIY